MKYLTVEDLGHNDLAFHHLEIFAESWSKRKSFSLYEQSPRPVCALFFLCADVQASFTDHNGKVVRATKGDVVFIPKGLRYRADVTGSRGVGIDTYTVNFEIRSAEGEEMTLGDTVTILATADDDRLDRHVAKLCETAHRVDDASGRNQLRLHAGFYSLLDQLCSTAQERTQAYYPIRMGADALRREWNQNEKMEKYAQLCGISPAYFYRCFRQWSGKSPVEYRNLLRLSNAETMLRYSDMKIGEISALIGFEDPFYFCRIFATQYGMSPREYRKAFHSMEA